MSSSRSNSSFKSCAMKLTRGQYHFSTEHQYDVFIAYSYADHETVKRHIITQLDSQYSGDYECCVEYRDFVPGHVRIDCVLEAMRKSYKTFLVLSHSYIKDGLFDFISVQNFEDEFKQKVILIKIDSVAVPEIMRQYVLLDFTELREAVFYKKLKQILLLQQQTATQHSSIFPPRLSLRSSESGHTEAQQVLEQVPTYYDYQGQDIDSSHYMSRSTGVHYTAPGTWQSSKAVYSPVVTIPLAHTCIFIQQNVQDESKRLLSQSASWSVTAFASNPREFVRRFVDIMPGSDIYSRVEALLFHHVMSQSETIDLPCLAILSLCRSPLIVMNVLHILEERILVDDLLTDEFAGDLKPCEAILQSSFISHHFQDETHDFQVKRIKVYGMLLYYLALHVERNHIHMFPSDLQRIQICANVINQLMSCVRLECSMRYSSRFLLEGWQYLSQLTANLTSTVCRSTLTNRINDLLKVTDYKKYCHSTVMEKSLSAEQGWVHTEVLLLYFGHRVSIKSSSIYVLLRVTHLLLSKSSKVSDDCSHGVLSSLINVFTRIAVTHPDTDVRHLAVFGEENSKKSCGLQQILSSQILKSSPLQEQIRALLFPYVFKSRDSAIRKALLNRIIHVAPGESLHNAPISEEDSLSLIVVHLKDTYRHIGQVAHLSSKLIHRCDDCLLIPGRFHQRRIAIKTNYPRSISDCTTNDNTNTERLRAVQNKLRHEASVLSGLLHSNIVELLAYSVDSVESMPCHLVLEYMDQGDLLTHLTSLRDRKTQMACKSLVDMLLQVCFALEFLAKARLVHRDICCHHILLGSGKETHGGLKAKLSGFHIARYMSVDASEDQVDPDILVRQSAHESYMSNVFSLESDVWMFGCLMFEVLTYGCAAYPECIEAANVHEVISKGHNLQQLECIPDELYLLILLCTHKEPDKRPPIIELRRRISEARSQLNETSYMIGKPLPRQTKDGMYRRSHICPYDDIYCPKDYFQESKKPVPHPRSMLGRSLPPIPDGASPFPLILETCQLLDPQYRDQPEFTFVRPQTDVIQGHFHCKEAFQGVMTRKLEKMLLEAITHRNLAQIVSVKIENPTTYLVTNLESKTSLIEYMMNMNQRPTVDITTIIHAMVQVADALTYLHSRHIVHRDLKLEYVYVTSWTKDGIQVKLGRIGRATTMYRGTLNRPENYMDVSRVPLDSLRWAAPEVLTEPAFYSSASDVYSFGVVIWQAVYALKVHKGVDYRLVVPHADWKQNHETFQENLLLGQSLEQPLLCPNWLYILMKQCWRERIKRAHVELILETLTSRKPFESALLVPFARRCKDHHYNNIDVNESQAKNAPYLSQRRNYGDSTEIPCLSSYLDESEDYYTNGASFTVNLGTVEDHPGNVDGDENSASGDAEDVGQLSCDEDVEHYATLPRTVSINVQTQATKL